METAEYKSSGSNLEKYNTIERSRREGIKRMPKRNHQNQTKLNKIIQR